MKRALILTVVVGLFGATLLQAGHKKHCCYSSCCHAVSCQSAVGTPVTTGASAMATPAPQASVASNGTTYRSYSYEPAVNNSSNFTYTTQSSGYSPTRRTPTYMLPKTDPRKFGSGF